MKERLTNRKKSKLKEIAGDSYLGEIVEIDDPKFEGRCKIRCWGIFGKDNTNLGKIENKFLPWAYPYYDLSFGDKTGSGKFSTPRIGTKVRVIFNEDIYHPRYISIETLNDELKALLKDDYDGFQSILFDSDNKIKFYHSKKSGILLDYYGSIFNILPDKSILIQHADSSSVIELKGSDIDIVSKSNITASSNNSITLNSNTVHANGKKTSIGAQPIYKSVNGDLLFVLLKILATNIDAKLPLTPGVTINIVNQMEKVVLSNTVKVSP